MKRLTKLALAASVFLAATTPVLAQSSSDAEAGVAFVILLMYCCFAIFGIVLFGIQIYLTVDAVQRDYGEDNSMQLVGILLLWLLGFPLGWILYFVLVMNKYPKKAK